MLGLSCLLIAFVAHSAYASPAPAAATSGKLFTTFAAYKYTGCRMNQGPGNDKPEAWNLTTTNSGCYTPSYSFSNFVLVAGNYSNSFCSLQLYPNKACSGTPAPVNLAVQGCYYPTDSNLPIGGSSISWACVE